MNLDCIILTKWLQNTQNKNMELKGKTDKLTPIGKISTYISQLLIDWKKNCGKNIQIIHLKAWLNGHKRNERMIRENSFFTNTHRTFIKIDYKPSHMASLSKFSIEKNGSCLITGLGVWYLTYSFLDTQESPVVL